MKKRFTMILSLLVFLSAFSFSEKANAETEKSGLSNQTLEKREEIIQKSSRDGEGAYEFGFLLANGLLDEPTYAWHEGSFDFPGESIVYHYKKHGKSVGANSASSYLNKAIEWRKIGKKNARIKVISGAVYGVKRYYKNGRYIDLAPDGRIVSFGTY
ncbi:hypothetical protein [Rossellomorea sp. BNER]|uniref:hypothetical protein n=1 Tax=Rossellomorea sp. BNER TaxID=2962031 RepID=UPI003AF1FB42|nr:hypothetical protein [Rossellomorea sp. BNER]